MQFSDNLNSDRDCFTTLKRWMENRNQGKMFSDYFNQYGYRKIAIYGAGDMGRLLYEEIKNSEITVSYFVDRNAEGIRRVESIPVISVQGIESMEKVDVLVVTPVGNYDEICRVLARNIPGLPTLSLREAVYEF